MTLNVKERGRQVATFRWVEVRFMETLATWVPTTPELEVKLVFGAHIWDAAHHADALGKRAQELRLPEQHSVEPAADYVQLLDEIAGQQETAKRVAGFYDCILPGLEHRYRTYMSEVDTLLDAPTIRIMERILTDNERMREEAADLRRQVPAVVISGVEWLDGLRATDLGLTFLELPDLNNSFVDDVAAR